MLLLPAVTDDNNENLYLFVRLAAIVIPPAHVLAFSEECEVSKEKAELFLKKHGGDMKAAMTAYIKGK